MLFVRVIRGNMYFLPSHVKCSPARNAAGSRFSRPVGPLATTMPLFFGCGSVGDVVCRASTVGSATGASRRTCRQSVGHAHAWPHKKGGTESQNSLAMRPAGLRKQARYKGRTALRHAPDLPVGRTWETGQRWDPCRCFRCRETMRPQPTCQGTGGHDQQPD